MCDIPSFHHHRIARVASIGDGDAVAGRGGEKKRIGSVR